MHLIRLLFVVPLALVVAACGEDENAAGNATDRAFVAAMIPHHEGAIEMAEVARERGESAFVKRLADAIIRTQSEEIDTMRDQDAELEDAGVARGDLALSEHQMGMGSDMGMLENAPQFDQAFLRMMIPHHEGAVRMAQTELAEGEDPELKALAEDIIAAQEKEIEQMRAELGKAGGAMGGGHNAHNGG